MTPTITTFDPTHPIPRVAHLYWTGSPIPSTFMDLLRRFLDINPEWQACVWSDETLPTLTNRALLPTIKRLSFKADLVRYELLARFGGVWMDWDIIHLKPMEMATNGAHAFACPERVGVYNNGIFGFTPGHPAAWSLVTNLARNFRIRDGLYDQLGVGYFTRTVKRYRDSISIVPSEFFHPYYGKDIARENLADHPGAVGIHFFNSNNYLGKVAKLIAEGSIAVPRGSDSLEADSRIKYS